MDEGTVEHIAEDRTQESLDGYYAEQTPTQLDGIEAVALDMWEPYIQATQEQVPKADKKIVFDRFHIMGHIGKAMDTVRKHEHRALMADTQGQSVLVALQPRERAGATAGGIRRTEAPGTQSGTGVGDQRGLAVSLTLRLPGVRLEVLEAVVFLGDAQPPGTDTQGGGDGLPAHRQHPDHIHPTHRSGECEDA